MDEEMIHVLKNVVNEIMAESVVIYGQQTISVLKVFDILERNFMNDKEDT